MECLCALCENIVHEVEGWMSVKKYSKTHGKHCFSRSFFITLYKVEEMAIAFYLYGKQDYEYE